MIRRHGVLGLIDLIAVTPSADAADMRHQIVAALKRNAQVEADSISVDVAGDRVTPRGKVHAWHERGVSERAAWSAAGVRSVDAHIEVV
ncbi:MAG: BON domain-containing protein [Methylorubrum rhodinum]|uniref:BON domain-containing protein n=1 Tax=Methylorubrum rhodinum TaxID=29428 RepID=UPI003BAF37A2